MNFKYLICVLVIYINLTQAAKWTGNFANFPGSWPLKNAGSNTNREVINDPTGGTEKVLKVKYPKGSCSSACAPIVGGNGKIL